MKNNDTMTARSKITVLALAITLVPLAGLSNEGSSCRNQETISSSLQLPTVSSDPCSLRVPHTFRQSQVAILQGKGFHVHGWSQNSNLYDLFVSLFKKPQSSDLERLQITRSTSVSMNHAGQAVSVENLVLFDHLKHRAIYSGDGQGVDELINQIPNCRNLHRNGDTAKHGPKN